jgi:hypothetical protein
MMYVRVGGLDSMNGSSPPFAARSFVQLTGSARLQAKCCFPRREADS